jgi:hypothetical protein
MNLNTTQVITRHPLLAHPLLRVSKALLLSLASSALFVGCVVHDGDYVDGYNDGYNSAADEGGYVEEVTVTTTTTTAEPINLFEDSFEDPRVRGGERLALERLPQWLVEWSEMSYCLNTGLAPSVEVQRDATDLDQGEMDGDQHVRLDSPCADHFSPVSLTTSLSGVLGAQWLRFYARAAADYDADAAGLMVIWGDAVVMDEPLERYWVEYEVDLSLYPTSHEAILSFMATNPGVIIDHVRVD